MKKLAVLAGVVMGVLTAGQAQDSVELYGYFESQWMGAIVNDQLQQVQSNKLRVDFTAMPSDRITFAANFDYITYHGKTEWSLADYLSRDIVRTIQPNLMGLYVIPFKDRQFLDNAYIKLAFNRFDLTFGKQQISLGSGYVWNPTDVFNIKDVMDPTYEQPGHNAIRVDMPLGLAVGLTALYSPEDTWNRSGKLVQVKARIPRFDVTVIAIETQWGFRDYTYLDSETGHFPVTQEKRHVFGGNLEGELLGLGLWVEYGYNRMEISKDFQEWVLGSNYTFDFQTFVMLEYYRNTRGKTDHQSYDLNDWMRYYAAEQKSISRDQLYVLIQHPVTDFIDIGLMNITSLSDGSLALVPTLNWSYAENLEITAYANINFGKEGKAYAKNSGSGGLLRARIYF